MAGPPGARETFRPSAHNVCTEFPCGRPPAPPAAQIFMMQVDVSGFSRLSETYSAKSSAGCEEFSHLLSFFFTRMCAIIDEHGGDIDCFAGDALVVVFSCRPQQTSKDKMCSEATASDKQVQPPNDVNNCGLNRQVSSALRCITCISKDLNGFQPSSEYPPLGIHAALAAGKLLSVVCGEPASDDNIACDRRP